MKVLKQDPWVLMIRTPLIRLVQGDAYVWKRSYGATG